METKKDKVAAALEKIRMKHGGLLRPSDVLEAAKYNASPLHDYFEWDDSEAARRYRMKQARDLIVSVTVTPRELLRPIQAYVSLKTDQREGGGYRATVEVLSDSERRRQLLKDAQADMDTFRRKYSDLNELAPVFDAIDGMKNLLAADDAA